MSMIAKDSGVASIEKLEGGVYTAVSQAIIDLGIQVVEKFNKTQRKFMMIWAILSEEIEINGEKQPRTISKEYSFSLSEKSILRKDLQAWRGKAFTEEELQGFDILNILNKACQLQILLEEKNNKKYNNIASIMALPKGTQVTKLESVYYLDLENPDTWSNWDKIPNWIREKIKKAENYNECGLDKYVQEYEETVKQMEDTSNITDIAEEADDLPF